jgi:O-antigen ligase
VPLWASSFYDQYRAAVVSPDRRVSGSMIGLSCVAIGLAWGAVVGHLGALLASLALVGATAGALMLRSTQWGFAALIGVICLLPFGALPTGVGFSPTFLDLVLLVIFFVWAVRVMTGRQREFMATPLSLPVAAFLVVAIAAFVSGLSHSRPSPNDLRRFGELLLGIAVYYAVVNSIQRRSQLRQMAVAVIAFGSFEALIGIVLYIIPSELTIQILSAMRRLGYPSGWGVLRFVNDDPTLPMRATSTSIDPNVLGGVMILVSVVTASQFLARRPVLPRLILIGSSLVVSLCLYLTYSRGSLVGLMAGLLLLGVFHDRRLLILVLVAGVAFVLLRQGQSYVQYFLEGLRAADRSTQMRLGEYKDALVLIGRYPWIGVGFAGTPDIDLYVGVSNLYLLVTEQMGALGLASFLLVLTVGFVNVARACQSVGSSTSCEPMLLGFGAALGGGLVAGMVDHYFFSYPHGVALFWLFMGLTMASARLAKMDQGASGILQYERSDLRA